MVCGIQELESLIQVDDDGIAAGTWPCHAPSFSGLAPNNRNTMATTYLFQLLETMVEVRWIVCCYFPLTSPSILFNTRRTYNEVCCIVRNASEI